MSLYSQNITFHIPPPRSILSWGPETSRAKIPDFIDLNELRRFMSSLFIFLFPNPIVAIQMKVGVACLSVIIFLCLVILIRIIVSKNLWVFRIVKTPTGPVIVPNAILAFLLIEMCFIVTLIATAIVIQFSYVEGPKKPKNLILWILLPWSTMLFGIFTVTLGMSHANPSACTANFANRKFSWQFFFRRIRGHSITINLVTFAIPLFAGVSVAIPAIIANARQAKVFYRELEWNSNYQNSTQYTQTMISEAQEIWYENLKAIKFASIAFCIWSFWGFCCLFIYITFIIRLLIIIKKGLTKTDLQKSNFNIEPISETPPRISLEGVATKEFKRAHFDIQEDHPDHTNRLNSQGDIIELHEYQNSEEARTNIFVVKNGMICPIEECPDTPTQENESDKLVTTSEFCDDERTCSRFTLLWFNLLKPIKKKTKKTKKIKNVNEECIQKQNLRKAIINIVLQSFIIIPGCGFFIGISLMLGLTFYGSFEQPRPNRITTYAQIFTGVALLIEMYTIIVLGFLNCCIVFYHVFEPIFIRIRRSTSNKTLDGLMDNSGI